MVVGGAGWGVCRVYIVLVYGVVGGAGWGVCRVYIVLVCGSRRCWVGCVQGVYSAGVW